MFNWKYLKENPWAACIRALGSDFQWQLSWILTAMKRVKLRRKGICSVCVCVHACAQASGEGGCCVCVCGHMGDNIKCRIICVGLYEVQNHTFSSAR